MKTAKIGATSLEASTLVLGTWAIGGWAWGGAEEKESIAAIRAALDEGINFIDTAPIYGQGISEQVVGKAIQGRRDSVIVATKAGLRWDLEEGQFNFEDDQGTRIYRNLKPHSLREEVERSLQNLQVETIDLLQTHWQDDTTAISETMETLTALKDEGKIRAIGVCNVNSEELKEYLAAGNIDSIQEMYSMIDRDLEDRLFPQAREVGLSVLAYSPLAMGLLTGKMGPERTFAEDDMRSWSPRFTVECRKKIQALLARFEPIREKYDLTTAQLVVAWTLGQSSVTHVLVGARNPSQARENAKAGQVELHSEDLVRMNKILEEEALEIPHPFLD